MKKPPCPYRKSRNPKSVRVFSTLTKTLQIFLLLETSCCLPYFLLCAIQFFNTSEVHIGTMWSTRYWLKMMFASFWWCAVLAVSAEAIVEFKIFLWAQLWKVNKKKNNQDIIEMLFDVRSTSCQFMYANQFKQSSLNELFKIFKKANSNMKYSLTFTKISQSFEKKN